MKKAQKELTKEQRYTKNMKLRGFIRKAVWIHPEHKSFFEFIARASREDKL